jgi:hypothetical protein
MLSNAITIDKKNIKLARAHVYRKSLKAAARMAAKAPVESSAMLWTAAEPLLVEAAVSLEVAEPVPEDDSELVEEAVVDEAADVWARASAVALRVPHCSLVVQFCWASASFGLLATHWI